MMLRIAIIAVILTGCAAHRNEGMPSALQGGIIQPHCVNVCIGVSTATNTVGEKQQEKKPSE